MTATDTNSKTSTQTVTVSDSNVIESAETLTDSTLAVTVNENATAVYTFGASDGVTYSLSGGADSGSNEYAVVLTATDASGSGNITTTVTVADIDDTAPSITGPTGRTAGEASYSPTALATSNLATEFAGLSADDDSTTSSTITVTTDSIIAPYAVVGDNTCFAYGASNDASGYGNFDRFKALGENSFGLEDTKNTTNLGDSDYDDLIIRFDFTAA